MVYPRPVPTFTIHELAKALGVERATVFRYLREGVLHRPPARNQYDESHLERGRLVRQLLEHGRSFASARAALVKIEREREAAARAERKAAAPVVRETLDRKLFRAWERVELVPGLELAMIADASPLVRRLAEDVVRHFALRYREATKG